jgi:sporulation integral membrane protein YlbJ
MLNRFFNFLKNYAFSIIILAFTICLIFYSNSNLNAAKSGLWLWANSVLPSLFPFFIATELLYQTNIINILGKIFNKFMKPIFNIPGEGSFALIMGIISGYPTGAKIAANFRKDGTCSKTECERLLSFTNNSGPLFIIGTVGISLFGSTSIGLLLFFTHILACLTVGFLFKFYKPHSKEITVQPSNKFHHTKTSNINLQNLGEIIGNSITNSISTILMIGGFIVLFSVIISILKTSKILYLLALTIQPILDFFNIPTSFATPLLTGILEITNGISAISAIHIKQISINIIFTAFLLGFGGISVLLQVFSIIAKTDLSIKPYIIGKFLHGIFAAFYTFLLINIFPFLNLNL